MNTLSCLTRRGCAWCCRFQTRGLFALAQLNGIVTYEVHNIVGVQPVVCMPNRVRSFFSIGERAPRQRASGNEGGDVDVDGDGDSVGSLV